MAQNRTIAVGRLAPSPLVCARVRLSHLILLLLPRTQTSLSRGKCARKGRREGDNARDVWHILFSRWRQE